MGNPGVTHASRRFAVGALIALNLGLSLALSGCERRESLSSTAPAEIVFAILSAQAQASAEPAWRPLLDDMATSVGIPVKPRFTTTYAGLIDDLRRGEVQAAWLSARPAVEAITSGHGELVARTVNAEGEASYRSTLIVRRGSGLTLDDVLSCGRRLNAGLGDVGSTSAALAPSVFLFNPRGIKPETCFKTSRVNTHERNAFEVASGVLDVAVSNTATEKALAKQNPFLAEQIETIWSSPPIPEGGIAVREDLDPATKEKIRSFLLSYGRGDSATAERQRRVLAGLNYSGFIAVDDDYLDPVREMVADEDLVAARRNGDAAAAAKAERELNRLRAKRQVQP